MKFKIILVTLLSLILLTGCKSNQTDTKKEQEQRNSVIAKNQKHWQKQVAKAKKIDQKSLQKAFTVIPRGYNDEDMSWSRLKSGNQHLIKGQIINLEPMLGRAYLTETKATIYVKQVLGGDKTIQGKTIKTILPGGLAEAKDAYLNVNGQYIGDKFDITDPKTLTYSLDATSPLPKIGQNIVTGVGNYRPENANRERSYRKYGLTTKNFYPVNNQDVTFWVQRQGKFQLNNSAFTKKNAPNLFKVTKRLNQSE